MMRLKVLLLLLLLTKLSWATTDCETTEVTKGACEALLTLYQDTQGTNWKNNTNWHQDNEICYWYGITCEGNRITELDLHKNGLKGRIPSQLGQLSDLTFLNLSWNQLTGKIPTELGQLTHLVTLNLNDNQLSGSIPATLGKLNKLRELYLYANQLSGKIPPVLGQLSHLQYLYLYNNQLIGKIPPSLSQLPRLQTLYLYHNQLNGAIPPELGQLKQLQYLYLYDNQLTGEIPATLGQLSDLIHLYLEKNHLSGTIPSELTQLPNLRTMNLSNNHLNGIIPDLSLLKKVIYIDLGHNHFTGETNGTATALDRDWATTQLNSHCDGTSKLRFNPQLLEFNPTVVGQTAILTQIVAYSWAKDCGTLQLDPDSFAITGKHATEFAIEQIQCKGDSRRTHTDASCTLEIHFSPTTVGQKRALLTFSFTDPSIPMTTVPLIGRSLAYD